jgi:hypothetical protein
VLPDRVPALLEVGIDYKSTANWPTGLTPHSKEPFEIGNHKLPGYRAYVVEVAARRLRLLDPTQDIDALRIQLADVQALIHLATSAKGKNKVKLLLVGLKAYQLWGDITAISDRAAWDTANIKATIQQMTRALTGKTDDGPNTLEQLVEASSRVIS